MLTLPGIPLPAKKELIPDWVSEADVLDLFAGPGGWDEGLKILIAELEKVCVGIEKDYDACATAEAAGHLRYQRNIAKLDPLDFNPRLWGLIASPPCQGFSAAGHGSGRADATMLLDAIRSIDVTIPGDIDTKIAGLHRKMHDHRSVLALEPLRWALALRPEWVAWEQVPAVLPIWEACAEVLRRVGYDVKVAKLHAEQHGVPQTRSRAILIGSRTRAVNMPTPAYSKYYAHDPERLDSGVLKWVSMAEALNWGMTARPYPSVTAGTAGGGADPMMLGGSGAREVVAREEAEGRWKYVSSQSIDGGDRAERQSDQPAVTITGTSRSATIEMIASSRSRAPRRSIDLPSPTIIGGDDVFNRRFEVPSDQVEYVGGSAVNSTRRDLDRPAPTVLFGESANAVDWEAKAPVESVQFCGAGVTSQDSAGQRPRDHDEPAHTLTGKGTAALKSGILSRRVTVQEAAILQSFRSDYPWSGSKTSQFQQVGNAIPPLLAHVILKEVTQ